MKRVNSKRGMELSLNTIIVAILVIILLVSVVTFFLFGFKGLTDRIKVVLGVTTAGTDLVLAQQTCSSYCQNAALLPEDIRKDSPYCKQYFFIDTDNDGEAQKYADKNYIKYYCYGNEAQLRVSCTVKSGDTTLDNDPQCTVASAQGPPAPITK